MKTNRWIRQVELNLGADLEHLGAPPMEVEAVLATRVLYWRTAAFNAWVRQGIRDGLFAQQFLGAHEAPDGSRLVAELCVRETVPTYSLNLNVHANLVEADVDYFNPDPRHSDLVGIVGHGVEWFLSKLGRKTNPFRVRRGLVRRGVPVPEAP